MVSTRSVKYKFSEGEKVLCYEPDPAKTKVLYNSKVLDVRVKKDSSGRKVAHFLIHFQGWNSTWDRFVTEDYILKDTEENRKLQKELAEKAQLTAGCGNLYRRERKKRGRVKLSGQGTTERQGGSSGGWSDGDTSCNGGGGGGGGSGSGGSVTAPIGGLPGGGGGCTPNNTHAAGPPGSVAPLGPGGCPTTTGVSVAATPATAASIKRHHTSDSDNSDEDVGGAARTRAVPFIVSTTLMSTLNNDHALITEKSKVVNLPGSPTAVDILEMWMREYTLSQVRLMCHNCQKRGQPRSSAGRPTHQITIDNFCNSANLCREVADGLRIFLDFTIDNILLYEEERKQHQVLFVKGLAKELIKVENVEKITIKENEESFQDESGSKQQMTNMNINIIEDGDRRKSLRSHIAKQPLAGGGQSATLPEESPARYGGHTATTAAATAAAAGITTICSPQQHYSAATYNQHGQPQPSTRCNGRTDSRTPSAEQQAHGGGVVGGAIDLASLLGPDANRGGEQLMLRPMSIKEREILKKVVSRKLLPEKYNLGDKIPLPSQIYGAIHLARALVKIPSMLATSDLNDLKMDLLIDYLTNFMKFLEEHPEWFSEENYIENTYFDEICNAASNVVTTATVKQEHEG